MAPYPHLANFVGAWFHQDFDIEGERIEDVVATFLKTDVFEERVVIANEIRSFLAAHPGPADEAFRDGFAPGVDPAGWGLTARQFLERVCDLLGRGR